MHGIAASTSETCSLGPAPKPTAAPENSLDFEATWAWTSSPITISQAPVRPWISLDSTRSAVNGVFQAREFPSHLWRAVPAVHKARGVAGRIACDTCRVHD